MSTYRTAGEGGIRSSAIIVIPLSIIFILPLLLSFTITASASELPLGSDDGTSLDATPGFIFIAIFSMGLWLFLASWTYKDARSRGRGGTFWFIMVLLFNILGIVLYFITQRKEPDPYYSIMDAIPLAVPVSGSMIGDKIMEKPSANVSHEEEEEDNEHMPGQAGSDHPMDDGTGSDTDQPHY